MSVSAFAANNEVTVKVGVTGNNNSRTKEECKIAGKKAAVQKYLKNLNANTPEKVIAKAQVEYSKFIEDIDVEDMDYEDGEMTATYNVTIKQEELGQWLKVEWPEGVQDVGGTKFEIVVLEEPPDVGAMMMADAFGTGLDGKAAFFARYTMFQRRVRDALVKAANNIGLSVKLLDGNDAYEEFKKDADDPVVGVRFDPAMENGGQFKIVPKFIKTVRDNNPNTLAMYYRIDTLAISKSKFQTGYNDILVSVALSIKDLGDNDTTSLGSGTHTQATKYTSEYTKSELFDEIGSVAEKAIKKIVASEGMKEKIIDILKSKRNAPKGPLTVVVNASSIDSKIRTRAKVMLKKEMIAAGLTDNAHVKITGNTITAVITKKDIPDADELWVALLEVMEKVGIEATDDQKTLQGSTLTVTPGK